VNGLLAALIIIVRWFWNEDQVELTMVGVRRRGTLLDHLSRGVGTTIRLSAHQNIVSYLVYCPYDLCSPISRALQSDDNEAY
jgi:hypothetical protein